MFIESLIAVVLFIALPFLASGLSTHSLHARIELILTCRHRDFLRSLKLGRCQPDVLEWVGGADCAPDYIMIGGVVQPYAALFERVDLLRQLGDPELDALLDQLQRRWWR